MIPNALTQFFVLKTNILQKGWGGGRSYRNDLCLYEIHAIVVLTKIRAQNIKLKEKLVGMRPMSHIIKTQFLILCRKGEKGGIHYGKHTYYLHGLYLSLCREGTESTLCLINIPCHSVIQPPAPTLTQNAAQFSLPGLVSAHPKGDRLRQSQIKPWVLVLTPEQQTVAKVREETHQPNHGVSRGTPANGIFRE